MLLSTTSILPVAPGPQNDPRWMFANALIKKLAKDQIEAEVAKHAPAARRLLFHRNPVKKNSLKLVGYEKESSHQQNLPFIVAQHLNTLTNQSPRTRCSTLCSTIISKSKE
eukprot:466198-Prorocentrum_minimum.AAC.2